MHPSRNSTINQIFAFFFKKYSIKFSKREKNTQIVHITNILQVHHKPQGYKERGLFVLFQEVVLNWKWK